MAQAAGGLACLRRLAAVARRAGGVALRPAMAELMQGNGQKTTTGEFLLERQEVASPDDAPRVILAPRRGLFGRRAERLGAISEGHSLGPFLRFAAALCRAQEDAIGALGERTLPGIASAVTGDEAPSAPLGPQALALNPDWGDTLGAVAAWLEGIEMPEAARRALKRLRTIDRRVLNAWAAALLGEVSDPVDPVLAPFVKAALEVHWVAMASKLEAARLAPARERGACPSCGHAPAVAVMHAEPRYNRARYLFCGLCATEWYMARIKCSNCLDTGGITYYGLQGQAGGIRAETCGNCRTYLKVLDLEKEPQLDLVADDLATIALDLKLAEQGMQRATPLPFVFAAPA